MIAIVGGTGPEGSGLALRWVRAGESVIIGSRDAERAQATAAQIAEKVGPLGSVEGADNATAVKMSDIVVLTVPFAGQAELLKQLKPSFRQGTVLIDATVPLAAAVGGRATRVLGVWQGSAAEQAAEIVGQEHPGGGGLSQPVVDRAAVAISPWTAMSSCAATTRARGRSHPSWRRRFPACAPSMAANWRTRASWKP